MNRLLVCGGRDFRDAGLMQYALALLRPSVVIHGAAPGADTLAGEAAQKASYVVEAYPADWTRFGRRAGPIRNATMLQNGRPDAVLAFPGGRGTEDMIAKARKVGVPVWELTVEACLDWYRAVVGANFSDLLLTGQAKAEQVTLVRHEHMVEKLSLLKNFRLMPEVKEIGWRELLASLGDPDHRVQIRIDWYLEIVDMALGELAVLVPNELTASRPSLEGAPVILRPGQTLRAMLPKGWKIEYGFDELQTVVLEAS